jgi:hypothetical protein
VGDRLNSDTRRGKPRFTPFLRPLPADEASGILANPEALFAKVALQAGTVADTDDRVTLA